MSEFWCGFLPGAMWGFGFLAGVLYSNWAHGRAWRRAHLTTAGHAR